jgi:hypothetical protein
MDGVTSLLSVSGLVNLESMVTQLLERECSAEMSARGQLSENTHLVQNTNDSDYQVVSIDQIDQMGGFDLFPTLSPSVKQHAGMLPPPEGRATRSHRHSRKRRHRYDW